MKHLAQRTAHELLGLLSHGEVTAAALVESVFDRIGAVEDRTRAFITLTPDEAMRQAESLDRRRTAGEPLPPLAGIPIAIKDNIVTRGVRTTCASRILEAFVPPFDATVVERLKTQEAVVIGKTNMDEFAMGSSTENSAVAITRNPWALDRIPGGSSGGSAAAVAADETILALGSDTGGSIRQPAACCGIVGLKPTYGRVSRYGLVAFASSLDQIGPLAKDVEDCALLLGAIAGGDALDSTCVDLAVTDYTASLSGEVRGLRFGIPREYFAEGIDPSVERAVREALQVLQERGGQVVELSLPHTDYAVATYYILATAEASSNLARYDGVRYGHRAKTQELLEMYTKTRAEGFGQEVKRRIMLGTYALSAGYYEAYYKKAQQVRTLIKQDFDQAFQIVDVLVTPTSPTPAFRVGEKIAEPLQMYLSDIFTISVNLAGIPAISLPCGLSQEGLPIGLQLLGRPFEEATILRAAHAFEQATPHHTRRPEL